MQFLHQIIYQRITGALWGLLLCCVISLLAGCRTVRYVPVETVRTDSVYVDRLTRDSVFVRDSVWVNRYVSGDTVYVDKVAYKYLYRDRWRRDTVAVVRRDSVAVEKPVYVEKQMKWYDKGFVRVGRLCCLAAVLWLLFMYLKRKF